MDPQTQTAFVPKRPIAPLSVTPERRARPVYFIQVVATIALLTAIGAAVYAYFRKSIVEAAITTKTEQLDRARTSFEPELVAELRAIDRRLIAAKELLGKHTALSPLFKEIGNTTLKTVAYTRFEYKQVGEGAAQKIQVTLQGTAQSFRTIALQSEQMTNNKYFIEPIFSGLTLTDSGAVAFTLTFTIDPSFISYREQLQRGGTTPQSAAPQVDTLESLIESLQ